MTMMELLVVIGVLATIAAIAIPSIRMITKERKIRETARQVNSVLAGARDAASVTGFAGVEFVRNTNYVDAEGVYFASTVMYRLKAKPVYAGDLLNSSIRRIQLPLGNTVTLTLDAPPSVAVSRGDFIRIDYRGPWYRVVADVVDENVTVELPNQFPAPPTFNFITSPALPGPAYQIYRRPVRDESSRLELTQGYYVDLRLSGQLDINDEDLNSNTATAFGLAPSRTVDQVAPIDFDASRSSVVLFYDETGAVDRVLPNGLADAAGLAFTPSEPIHFLVVRDPTGVNVNLNDNLDENTNLWVSVDEKTGTASTTNVGEMTTETNIFDRIRSSQLLARRRQSATQ